MYILVKKKTINLLLPYFFNMYIYWSQFAPSLLIRGLVMYLWITPPSKKKKTFTFVFKTTVFRKIPMRISRSFNYVPQSYFPGNYKALYIKNSVQMSSKHLTLLWKLFFFFSVLRIGRFGRTLKFINISL